MYENERAIAFRDNTNREAKDIKKPTKYSQLRLGLTNRHPEYKTMQYNIIIDVLGGFSREVTMNVKF